MTHVGSDLVNLLRQWRAQPLARTSVAGVNAEPLFHTCTRICSFIHQAETFLCTSSGNVHLCGQERCTSAVEIPSGWKCLLTETRWEASGGISPFTTTTASYTPLMFNHQRLTPSSKTMEKSRLSKNLLQVTAQRSVNVVTGTAADGMVKEIRAPVGLAFHVHADRIGTSFDSSFWGRKNTLRVDSHFAAKSADAASSFHAVLRRVVHFSLSSEKRTDKKLGQTQNTSTVCSTRLPGPLHSGHREFAGEAVGRSIHTRLDGPVRRVRVAVSRRRKAEARGTTGVIRVVAHRLFRNDLSLKRQASSVLDLLLARNASTTGPVDLEVAACRKVAVRDCLHLWTEFHRVCAQVLKTDLVYDFRCHCYVAFHAMCYGNQYSDFKGDVVTRRVHLLRKNQWLAENMDVTIDASTLGLRKGTLKECRRLFGIFIKHLARIQNAQVNSMTLT
jgi:hypothetical protein